MRTLERGARSDDRSLHRARQRSAWGAAVALALVIATAGPARAQPRGGTVAPSDAPWSARMAPEGEPGERLVVEGTVRGAGGEPLAGVSVYAYQTGANGIYGPRGSSDPRLRVHLRTDRRGRYRFETIRPGSYPGTRIAAHIHFHVTPAGGDEQVSEVVFEGDPFVTATMRKDPFFVVRPVERGADGFARVTYDVAIE
jgi:protocatechuate 3,4-dioxygenase beta subunit